MNHSTQHSGLDVNTDLLTPRRRMAINRRIRLSQRFHASTGILALACFLALTAGGASGCGDGRPVQALDEETVAMLKEGKLPSEIRAFRQQRALERKSRLPRKAKSRRRRTEKNRDHPLERPRESPVMTASPNNPAARHRRQWKNLSRTPPTCCPKSKCPNIEESLAHDRQPSWSFRP